MRHMRDVKPLLEVAIEARGISPKDVPIRHVVELLEAAIAALDAVAREKGLEPPLMRLVGVRQGSASYELYSDGADASAAVQELYQATRDRGANSGTEFRKALHRLHAAGKVGQVRLTSRVATPGNKAPRPINVAAPVNTETEQLQSEMAAEYYGRIVGLFVKNEQTFVRLRLDDGGTEDFRVRTELERRIGSFFNTTVRVYVVHKLSGVDPVESTLESIEEWSGDDFLRVMRALRDDLTKKGVSVDVEAWLQELDS